ncbi:DUF1275 domain-containing protein [[Clostridium] spiroforme]|nr:DUF1275 domain-containing protein [Thomasclavelia spiroformis]MBM6880586.1 DUF1275 domain-containing protein [Thomasclavelia spiroformis]
MDEKQYLKCEKWYIFLLLITVGGFYGGYTYAQKGGIFCNAQTANIVLFGMALGKQDWNQVLYLLIPISAYFLGTMVSEYTALKIKKLHFLRWDTVLVGIEMMAVLIMGLLPSTVPDQVFQVTINFICAMQFNTFRQAENIPMATTFVTNHVRQTGSYLVRWLRKKDEKTYLFRSMRHFFMIAMFVIGAMLATMLCVCFHDQAILFALIVLGFVFVDLVRADLIEEKELLNKVPGGH